MAEHKQQDLPKFLRLSSAMSPESMILKIQLARRDQAINGLSCRNINLNLYEDDGRHDKARQRRTLVVQDPPGQAATAGSTWPSLLLHLRDLFYSRHWLRIEFDGCVGVYRLLVEAPGEVPNVNNHDGKIDGQSTRPKIEFLSYRCEYSDFLFRPGRLWKFWKIQKCRLSGDFVGARLDDFTNPGSASELTELDLTGSSWGMTFGQQEFFSESERISVWRQFCRALVYNHPHLQKLEIRKAGLSDSWMAALVGISLSRHPNLEELHVSGNNSQWETLIALSMALSKPAIFRTSPSPPFARRLKALTISNDRLSEDVVQAYKNFADVFTSRSRLLVSNWETT